MINTLTVIGQALRRGIVVAALLSLPILATGCSGALGGRGDGPKTALAPTPPASEETITAVPEQSPPPVSRPAPKRIAFDGDRAMREVEQITAFGVREAGKPNERKSAEYVMQRLRDLGYDPVMEEYPLTDGRISVNVIATAKGKTKSDRVIVLGGHLDSKVPSPGANDNASGCGVMLELARIFAKQPVVPNVEFVFFGSEEIHDADPNHHHFGARYRVKQMSAAERERVAGMISIDMVGYGSEFLVRTMKRGPQTMSNLLLKRAKRLEVPLTYARDPGESGWSDHEPYEEAGIPAAWLEWRVDPVYHTAGDTFAHVDPGPVKETGDFVLAFMRGLREQDLDALASR